MERQRKLANILETYFSDANLLWDKVMQSKMGADGYASFESLKTLPKFKAIAAQADEIKEAAQSSKRLQIKEDGSAVGRIKPFIKNKKEELTDWSIYVEGLRKPYDTEDAISKLFTRLVGHVSFIRFPDGHSGHPQQRRFYGFCFIEFDDRENVQKAVDLLNRCEIGTKGKTTERQEGSSTEESEAGKLNLRVMTKADWLAFKDKYLEYQASRKRKITETWGAYNATLNQESDREISEEQAEAVRQSAEKKPKVETEATPYPKGVIAFVTNLHEKSSKTTIKQLLQQSGATIEYLNYKKGIPSCHIRVNSPNDMQKLVKYFEQNKVVQKEGSDALGEPVDETKNAIHVKPLTGTEEEIYWKNDTEAMRKFAKKQ